MKKGRIILTTAVVLATIGSAFAFKVNKVARGNLYTLTNGAYTLIQCSSINVGIGYCSISSSSITVYTFSNNNFHIYSGGRFASPSL